MKLIIFIITVLIPGTVVAHKRHSIGISHRQEQYYLTKTCYDIIEWEEVVLINQQVQHKINSVIRKAVRVYKEQEASLLCDKELNYSATRTFKVVYAQNGIISYRLESDIYYKGILHDCHSLNTLNFNAKTGEQITLDSLIDYAQLLNFHNLVITKLIIETELNSNDSLDVNGQLEQQNFLVTNEGILLLYQLRNYPIHVLLTFKELKSYANKNGLLQRLDGR